MPSTRDKSTGSLSRRQIRAAMGNFGNDDVDRSEETILTRRQKRQLRRQTLRNQAEIAPFLGMDLFDEEENKDVKEADDDNTEKKAENDMIIPRSLHTIPEAEEPLEEKTAASGPRGGNYEIARSGGSDLSRHDEKWWKRNVTVTSARKSMTSRTA